MDANEIEILDIAIELINQPNYYNGTLPNVISLDSNEKLEEFPVFRNDLPSYSEFFENCIIKNRPCMFSNKLLIETWGWIKDFSLPDTNQINFDFIRETYGEIQVSITHCTNLETSPSSVDNYDDPVCETMKLKEFLDYWKNYMEKGYPESMPCLYLKDWHLIKNAPVEQDKPNYMPYSVPKYFASDWLNEVSEGQSDDFRFAYMGPKGSWTPFHADVYGSYSWSTNIIGIKRWYLYPPHKENLFRNSKSKLVFDFMNPGRKDIDYYEITQHSGEILFVPSGWHHMVWNLEDTISINHNWINAANIMYIWTKLKEALSEVKQELNDLTDLNDFPEICQNLLKANYGMNYITFVDLLENILRNRQDGVQYIQLYALSKNHIKFDIARIERLLGEMKIEESIIDLCNAVPGFNKIFTEIVNTATELLTPK